MVACMTIEDTNLLIQLWRAKAKVLHGYTDVEIAEHIGCSTSTLRHKASNGTLYTMPVHSAIKLMELANNKRGD